AYLALQKALDGKPRPEKIGGFTPEQRFFLAFAQSWRRNTRPEMARQLIVTDPHSPARFRVLGPISNMPEFLKAFGCEGDNSMARPEALRVKIW
ncbi:MAG TPA: M13-type metalloendopeptidase, partial [Blastocatellia bacterium]|nr:M13-type metalloendopeptidase [Blastocatellia bacterium]